MRATLTGGYLVAEGLDDYVFGAAVQMECDDDLVWSELWQAWHFCFYTARVWPTVH